MHFENSPHRPKYIKKIVRYCRRILSAIHTIFTTDLSVSDMNKIYNFYNIVEYLYKLKRAQIDGQTDKANA